MLRLEMVPELQRWCFVRVDGSVVNVGPLRPYRFRCDALDAAAQSGLSVSAGGAVSLCVDALEPTVVARVAVNDNWLRVAS